MSDQLDTINRIIEFVSKTEKTDELGIYWQKRYQAIFAKKLFTLSQKTLELLTDSSLIDKPATPFGEINLVKHLDGNNLLDEILLQTTVESCTRFLDASLEVINFTVDARNIVSQYRKIGIALADFEEYLECSENKSRLEEIDYIGGFVSNASYRASESLAEEKGRCLNWEKINHHLRMKAFEFWVDYKSGEIISSLDLYEMVENKEKVDLNQMEIVPRRNSHLLLLPTDSDWVIWSDRDESTPPTEVIKLNLETNDISKNSKNNQKSFVSNISPTQSLIHSAEILSNSQSPISEIKGNLAKTDNFKHQFNDLEDSFQMETDLETNLETNLETDLETNSKEEDLFLEPSLEIEKNVLNSRNAENLPDLRIPEEHELMLKDESKIFLGLKKVESVLPDIAPEIKPEIKPDIKPDIKPKEESLDSKLKEVSNSEFKPVTTFAPEISKRPKFEVHQIVKVVQTDSFLFDTYVCILEAETRLADINYKVCTEKGFQDVFYFSEKSLEMIDVMQTLKLLNKKNIEPKTLLSTKTETVKNLGDVVYKAPTTSSFKQTSLSNLSMQQSLKNLQKLKK